MITRRAQERAHSLKTGLPPTASSRPGDERLLSPSVVRREQKREQVEAVHVFDKDSAEIIAVGVRRGSRDVLFLPHGHFYFSLGCRLRLLKVDNNTPLLVFSPLLKCVGFATRAANLALCH